MTQEEKQLVLIDICARLPYGVKIELMPITKGKCTTLTPIILRDYYISDDVNYLPYLRPMSSMTEEEKEDLLITLLGENDTKYFQVLSDGSIDNNDAAHQDLSNFNIHWINFDGVNTSTYIDWLNTHHFDYRGLIEKNLALDCTGLHIYD